MTQILVEEDIHNFDRRYENALRLLNTNSHICPANKAKISFHFTVVLAHRSQLSISSYRNHLKQDDLLIMKEQTGLRRDTQVKGLIGRSRLIEDLLRAGLEVAVPLRDRGIDLIAYKDFESFIARPIQVKAASARNFSIDRKYEKIRNLIIAFVWNANDPNKTETYALTYRQAVAIGNKMGWTKTASWKKGKYTQNNPSQELVRLLKPYKMTPERWRKKVTERSQLNPN